MENNEKCQRPLNQSVLIAMVIFTSALCLVLCVMQYFAYSSALYERYESYIGNLLTFTASGIDVDDLKECIETGEKSEEFHRMQKFLDSIRENTDMHFLYIIVPLNTEPVDNIMNVAAAVTEYEYMYMADQLVRLNQLTGDSYSSATAEKYLKAYESGELSFFEEVSQRGDDYTGLLPLYDSQGEKVAALCMDVEILDIHAALAWQMIKMLLVIIILGVIFSIGFFVWADINITYPIAALEESVTKFAKISHEQRDPDALILDVPDINTKNEVESLAKAVKQMSENMRNYVNYILSTEQELEKMNLIALKDSLTGVGNKAAFDNYAEDLNDRLKSEQPEFAILMLDLNFLKQINDSHGHERGDTYLKNCCKVICHVFTHSPVFRLGGDEFTVVLMGEDYENRYALLIEAQMEFHKTERYANPWERLSVAMGIAEYRREVDDNVESVLRRADRKMYLQKKKMKAVRTV